MALPPQAEVFEPVPPQTAVTGQPWTVSPMRAALVAGNIHVLALADIALDAGSLGEGSYGVVRSGTWGGKRVAVKIWHCKDGVFDASMFQREVCVHHEIHAPNLVMMYGCIVEEPDGEKPTYGIVMPLLKESLYTALIAPGTPRDVSLIRKLSILCDVARGLADLHASNITHMDLKSSNVLLTEDGVAQLSDFGMSEIKRTTSCAETSMRVRATIAAAGVVAGGTMQWMAPEQHDLKKPTPASDVYAFGVLIWEVMAQATPYKDLEGLRNIVTQLPSHVIRGGRPTLSLLPNDTPADVLRLMQECWAEQPGDRPAIEVVSSTLCTVAQAAKISIPCNSGGIARQVSPAILHLPPALSLTVSGASLPVSSRCAPCELAHDHAVSVDTNEMGPTRVASSHLMHRSDTPPTLVLLPGHFAHEAARAAVRTAVLQAAMIASYHSIPHWVASLHVVDEESLHAVYDWLKACDAATVIAIAQRVLEHYGPDVVQIFCVVLRQLCMRLEHAVAIAIADGIKFLLEAVEKHVSHAGVVEAACGALEALAAHVSFFGIVSGECKVAILPEALVRHSSHAAVAEASCCALRVLTTNTDNCITVSAAGCTSTLLTALKRHAGNSGVAESACGTLRNLAVIRENKAAIAAEGGISIVLHVMSQHVGHAGTMEAACGVLHSLCVHQDIRHSISGFGVIPVVLNALRHHALHAGVAQQGYTTLRVLFMNQGTRKAIVQAGGIDALISTIGHHADDVGVASLACGALRILARDHDDCSAIVRAGGVRRVLHLLTRHADETRVVEPACAILWYMSNDEAGLAHLHLHLEALPGCERAVCLRSFAQFASYGFYIQAADALMTLVSRSTTATNA